MGKKRNQPEVLSPDLPDTSKSEKEQKEKKAGQKRTSGRTEAQAAGIVSEH